MFSRAHLLIEREFERLIKGNIWGIEAYPITDENIFEWAAKIRGLKDTLWEEGIFRIYIKFDEHYNARPPQVCFHTIPFHPNVDMITGRPCIDFLDDFSYWKESYSIEIILLTIQAMLSNPVLENAINPDAVNMILDSPHSYKQMVLDCVAASQRVDAGFSPHLSESHAHFRPTPEPPPDCIHPTPLLDKENNAKLSFDEYHMTWSGIATSKSRPDMVNPLVERLKDYPHLEAVHYSLSFEELDAQTRKQMEDHNLVKFGQYRNQPKTKTMEAENKAAKLAKVERMRKIYLPRRTPTPGSTRVRFREPVPDMEEQEVDDLVAWTNQLDENNI